eukprot:Tamp_19054.p1 GENE.Tamp_19054~~Tamp_19054.p1  ORF type:complete len:164 (+),score=48.31 Tamp_19054:462-953(+)
MLTQWHMQVQMAEWEARYGDAGGAEEARAAARPPPIHVGAAAEPGFVELDLTGGEAASPGVNALMQEIQAQGGAIGDLSDPQSDPQAQGGGGEHAAAAGGDVDGSSSANLHAPSLHQAHAAGDGPEVGGQVETEEEGARASSGGAPTTPKAQQVPSSDDMDDM